MDFVVAVIILHIYFYSYENKGAAWLRSKPSLPPGVNPEDYPQNNSKQTVQSDPYEGMSKAAKKNAKRKEKKKQTPVDQVTKTLADTAISNAPVGVDNGIEELSDKAGLEKKLRNLQKKLKQIQQLEQKIKSGEIANPEKEQIEKVSKKKNLESEIEDIQLDLADL